MRFPFTNTAKKQWQKLDPNARAEMERKIEEMKQKPELFSQNLKTVSALDPATHRLRVGQYRLLLECDFESQTHIVLKLGHRKEVYL